MARTVTMNSSADLCRVEGRTRGGLARTVPAPRVGAEPRSGRPPRVRTPRRASRREPSRGARDRNASREGGRARRRGARPPRALARSTFCAYMRPLRARVEDLLREGTECWHPRPTRHARSSSPRPTRSGRSSLSSASNRRTTGRSVPAPCRPLAQGMLRPHSEAGSRFVERILTTRASLRQQNRSVLGFIRTACLAKLRGLAPPSLLMSANQAERRTLSLAA